jgi:hypothetical protein
MTPSQVFGAASFHLQPMAPHPRETRVGLDTFCPGTGSSLTEAGQHIPSEISVLRPMGCATSTYGHRYGRSRKPAKLTGARHELCTWHMGGAHQTWCGCG